MTLRLTRYYANIKPAGTMLSFSAYADGPLTHDASPLIQVTDERGVGSPTIRIVAKGATLPARQWVRVRLPFSSFTGLFKGTSDTDVRSGAAGVDRLHPGPRRRRPRTRCSSTRSGSTTATARRPEQRLSRAGGPDGARLRPSRRPDVAAGRRSPDLLHYRIHRVDRRRAVRAGRHPEGDAHPLRRLRRCQRPAGGLQDQRGRHRLSTNRRRRRPSARRRARSPTTSC